MSVRQPSSVTPRVSSRSRVAPTSRIDFTPAQTTVIGVRASVTRSADSSALSTQPRCTPPSPPVANTRIPARAASTDVEATVVAPVRRSAAATGRSRTDSFATSGASAIIESALASRPIVGVPAMTAIVAGVTPRARSRDSSSAATSRLRGRGSPCAISVDSSATTGRPASSATRTSSATTSRGACRPGGFFRSMYGW